MLAQQLLRDQQAAEAEVARLEMRLISATIATRPPPPSSERSEWTMRTPLLSGIGSFLGSSSGAAGGRDCGRLDSLESSPASTLRTATSAGTLRRDACDPLRSLGLSWRDGDFVDSAASSSRTTLLGEDSRPPSSRMTSAPTTDRSGAPAYGVAGGDSSYQQQQQEYRKLEEALAALAFAPSVAPLAAGALSSSSSSSSFSPNASGVVSGVIHLAEGTRGAQGALMALEMARLTKKC
jgi:hypothetical protein